MVEVLLGLTFEWSAGVFADFFLFFHRFFGGGLKFGSVRDHFSPSTHLVGGMGLGKVGPVSLRSGFYDGGLKDAGG